MANLIRHCDWTLKLNGSELEYLGYALNFALASKSFLNNYDGDAGEWAKKLSSQISDELVSQAQDPHRDWDEHEYGQGAEQEE